MNRHLLADDEAESLVEFLPWRLLEDDWLQVNMMIRERVMRIDGGSEDDDGQSA